MLRRFGEVVLCVTAAWSAYLFLDFAVEHDALGVDLRAFVPAADAVLSGASPYPVHVTREELLDGVVFLYPPVAAFLFSPLTLIPGAVTSVVATVLMVACVPATLLVLGVRDWRCHVAAFLWLPVLLGVQTANLSLPMMLACAVVWRYRDRASRAGLIAAAAVSVKLFLWPLVIWLAATRRYRAAVVAGVGTVVLLLGPWAVIGFSGLRDYPQLLDQAAVLQRGRSITLAGVIGSVASWEVGSLVAGGLGLTLLVLVVIRGRRLREADALALALAAALVLSPIVHLHYFALLLVVFALKVPTFSAVWLLPLPFWIGGGHTTAASPVWTVAYHFGIAAAIVAVLTLRRRRTGAASASIPAADHVVARA